MVVRGRLPGTRIDQVFRANSATPRDFPRYAAIIAKGLDIKLFQNAAITRGQVTAEILPVSGTTYTAPLAHAAIPDKTRARLYTSDGRTIPNTRWNYQEGVLGSNVWNQIVIDSTLFSSGTTYLFDYVSTDPLLRDDVPVDDLREVLKMGDNAGQIQYTEGVDYRFITSMVGPDPATGNTNPSASVTAPPNPGDALPSTTSATLTADKPVVQIGSLSGYQHPYNRAYVLTCTSASGAPGSRVATLQVESWAVSSGHQALPGLSALQANLVTISIAEASPLSLTNQLVELGIHLDFVFPTNTSANFVVGDTFTMQGDGPGILETSDAMQNDNQFAELSAVAALVSTGQGAVSINDQSVYSGANNQTYELQCVNAMGTGSARQATFRWRSNPKLLVLAGTVSVTNLGTTVTGLSTQFMTEVQAGDYLFIAGNPRPVKVAGVTNATTLTLTGAFFGATVSGAKVLRYRESTGSVLVNITAPSRVTLDQGVFLDFNFDTAAIPVATDNFALGDTFQFTAMCARNQYNGKENRTYTLNCTSTATSHQAIMSFYGNTPASTFGTHTFAEGAPLVLPNNVVLHARNLSLADRFAAPVDKFELSLSFDGLVDWTLEAERTETISTADFLRDLDGQKTGTVGAFYVETRKVPDTVVYVKGPSNQSIAFNQVAGTTIIYFLTSPGVNLTIKYRFVGIEPNAGATYYLTGYAKRPDSDYAKGQVFTTRGAAENFLAPMTVSNDAAIANQIAWDQDELNLPGVVFFLVKDSDGDGVHTNQDYENAIRTSQEELRTLDAVVVNQFSARDTFRDSIVNMNSPSVHRRRIGYYGYPTNYPIGDEFTAGSRVFTARRELQVFQDSIAKGTLAIIGNSYAKKTISVDALGDGNLDTIDTQVTLDGSFLAVALAARVASFPEPWQVIYQLPLSGFDEVEYLSEQQMIQLQDAGVICARVDGNSAFYVGTMTTDNTEPSTQQLNGTVQRQYVFSRLQQSVDENVIGYVADSPEDVAQRLTGDLVMELGNMVSTGKIGKYVDPTTGVARAIQAGVDVVAFRDKNDPTRAYFRASFYNKYAILDVDGLLAVDAPTP